jgi:hypothetical protein
MVREAVDSAAAYARRAGLKLVTIGVALDPDWLVGATHLREVAAFDQIASGGGWVNELGFRYLHDTHPGPASTPQLLFLRRTLEVEGAADWTIGYGRENELLNLRLVGTLELERWLARGARIPNRRTGPM